MEIVLVRHAQPDWEPGGIAVDRPSLTPFGRAQAQRTGAALAFERFDHFYASPLERARETAEAIVSWVQRGPRVSELARGAAPALARGRDQRAGRAVLPRARATRDLASWWERVGSGRRVVPALLRARGSRASRACSAARTAPRCTRDGAHRLWQIPDPERRLLIVAHEGTNAVILSHLLGIDPIPWAFLRFSTAWCGISRIRTLPVAGARVWVLESFNRLGHLDGLLAPT